jgi:signal transduction histidine kinase/ligand-binding sensor domain-containing protein
LFSAILPAVDAVTCLAQDSSGFIWIGSTDGLFRFDGFNYKAFYSSSEKNEMLHSSFIRKLFVDSKGRLWIATYDKGLSMLEQGVNQMSQVCCMIANSPVTKPIINDIKEDSKGNIWFTTLDGLLRVSPDGKVWNQYKQEPTSGVNNKFDQFTFDPSGLLLIAGYSGLVIFDPGSEKFITAEDGLKKAFKKSTYFKSIAYHHNKVWFSTWVPDLGVYNVESKKLSILYSGLGSTLADFTKMAIVFYPDSKGGLWIATENGLYLAAEHKDEIAQSFFHQPDNSYSIISNKISSVLEDREGNMWIGTDEGISIGNPYKVKVSNYSVNALHNFSFANKLVSNIIELDDHSFLICTHNADGTYKTDRQFNVQHHYSYKNTDWDWIWKHYNDEKTKQVYISTQEGMLVYDQKLKTIRKSTNDFFSTHYPIASFVPVSDDEVWVSCFRNLFYKYNLRTGQYKEYNISKLGEPPQVLYLSRDNENKLWILGHTSGLLQFDEQKEKIVERLTPDSTLNSLRQSGVYVFLDLGETFLIGYDTHGMSLYHKRTKQFEHFTRTEGLISNSVRDAFVAADKTVWIATGNGISHFNPLTRTFINYDQAQGILQNDLTCIYPVSDGRIVAGTNKGIFVFSPDNLVTPVVPPAPSITEISVLGKKIDMNSLGVGERSLHLSYKENYFSFDFISLQYSNSNMVEYAYQLEGLETNWNMSGNRRFVSYANIPAGNYTFKVKCRLPGGQWIENKKSVSVKVQAAFYNQWWFFFIIGLLAALVIYAFFRYRIQQLLKLEKMRSAISSDLHDEVGTALTSISIFSEMARKTAPPLSKEDQYLQRIGDRSRESIEKMSDIIWSINPNSDSLEQMLVRMKNYTTEIAEAKDIAIHWEESNSLPHFKLSMEHRKNIYLLYKEAVNNVIKHAGAKNIYILLQSLKNGITLRIRDDGKGFDFNTANNGNGLKNMKRRATTLKGTIDIISGSNNGTSIQLFIPY